MLNQDNAQIAGQLNKKSGPRDLISREPIRRLGERYLGCMYATTRKFRTLYRRCSECSYHLAQKEALRRWEDIFEQVASVQMSKLVGHAQTIHHTPRGGFAHVWHVPAAQIDKITFHKPQRLGMGRRELIDAEHSHATQPVHIFCTRCRVPRKNPI